MGYVRITQRIFRHCERSEAIQEIFYGFYGLLRRAAPRNDALSESAELARSAQ